MKECEDLECHCRHLQEEIKRLKVLEQAYYKNLREDIRELRMKAEFEEGSG